MEVGVLFIEPSQAVGGSVWNKLRPFEVGLYIEMWISILLVQSSAFFDDLCDLSGAGFLGLLVGCKRIDPRYGTSRRMCGGTFRIQIVG